MLVAALMESLAAGVATAQEEVCGGERKAGRRRESRGGCLVVVLASCGGAGVRDGV